MTTTSPDSRPDSTIVPTKYLKSLFWLLWFVAIPFALAWLTFELLKPAQVLSDPHGFDWIPWLIQDQTVPAFIVFFTIYEMALYHFRYSLPLSNSIGVGGRSDVPKNARRLYETGLRLVDEAAHLEAQHTDAINKQLAPEDRAALIDALDGLKSHLTAKPFRYQGLDTSVDKARSLVDTHLGQWRKGELREYVESIAIAIAVALLLRVFVIEAFKIPSGSMLPTLQLQDHIFVNKFTYGLPVPFSDARLFNSLPPKRGDVVVFEYPNPDPRSARQDYIKRVIAIPGDTLEAERGHPIINGWKVPHCLVGPYPFQNEPSNPQLNKSGALHVEFLGDYAYLTLYEEDPYGTHRHQGPFVVKPGEFWVMGDNRNNSHDSRAWRSRGGKLGAGVPFGNVKGRAMFVWLNPPMVRERFLHNVMGAPKLPERAPQTLHDGVERCMAQRPSNTFPPAH